VEKRTQSECTRHSEKGARLRWRVAGTVWAVGAAHDARSRVVGRAVGEEDGGAA
jgi:hypothetical protein